MSVKCSQIVVIPGSDNVRDETNVQEVKPKKFKVGQVYSDQFSRKLRLESIELGDENDQFRIRMEFSQNKGEHRLIIDDGNQFSFSRSYYIQVKLSSGGTIMTPRHYWMYPLLLRGILIHPYTSFREWQLF